VQALTRAADRLGEPAYLDAARSALPLFEAKPPSGVRVTASRGAYYAMYSYSPGYRVLNGFIQTLVGLWDMSTLGGDDRARRLFDDGDAEARRIVGSFDTGAWSLYAPGEESSLEYHTLVRDFLRNLCQRITRPPVEDEGGTAATTGTVRARKAAEETYCQTADRFTRYLSEPPAVALVSRRARGGQSSLLRFRLSKISRVGVTVRRTGRVALATSATVGRGVRGYRWTPPRTAGRYEVVLLATDLAGNSSRTVGEIEVLPPKKRG
jgi:hypothetical protein